MLTFNCLCNGASDACSCSLTLLSSLWRACLASTVLTKSYPHATSWIGCLTPDGGDYNLQPGLLYREKSIRSQWVDVYIPISIASLTDFLPCKAWIQEQAQCTANKKAQQDNYSWHALPQVGLLEHAEAGDAEMGVYYKLTVFLSNGIDSILGQLGIESNWAYCKSTKNTGCV